jgi:hypothetical protein
MKSILLIIPYFGKWPIWFDAYLISIRNNPTIHWLIITDCKLPISYPDNIKFVSITLSELNTEINTIVGVNVPLTPRKFCDLKPAYGIIFNEYLKTYDFWGICDLDIVWGNIRKFITPQLLENYEIISTLENMISGHFTLFKNTNNINTLYKEVEDYKTLFEQHKYMRFDEYIFTNFLKNKDKEINIFWNEELVNNGLKSEVHQEYYLDRWLYDKGMIKDMFSVDNKEYMYLHFINWKKTIKKCEVSYNLKENFFYVSYSGIHYKKHSSLEIIFNDFTNLFDGFYVRLRKRKYLKKITKFKKKILKFNFKK